jgi:hypothetical protein
MKEMSDDRRRACEKQIAAGNDPEHTRPTEEEEADFNCWVTLGPAYRQKIQHKIRQKAKQLRKKERQLRFDQQTIREVDDSKL